MFDDVTKALRNMDLDFEQLEELSSIMESKEAVLVNNAIKQEKGVSRHAARLLIELNIIAYHRDLGLKSRFSMV